MINQFKYIIVLILLAVCAFFSWQVYFKIYKQEDTVNIHRFPREIGEWKSTDLVMTEKEYETLETRNVFVREYINSKKEKVYLFIVYSENNRKVSHPPEICYTGSGFSVVDRHRDRLEGHHFENSPERISIPTNRLEMELGRYSQLAYYWFKAGDKFTASYLHQQLILMTNSLLKKSMSGALIRISADVDMNNVEQADHNIRAFADEMIPYLYTYLP